MSTQGERGSRGDGAMESLVRRVVRQYGVEPGEVRVVVSPYRICPLGAHVDHQSGSVTAMAIDRGVLLAYAPSREREVRLSSLDFPGEVRFSIDEVPPREDGDWGNYARGAVLALREEHPLRRGIVGVTSGRLGEGGLSSSAAVGVAYLLALEEVNGMTLPPEENIVLDRAIENRYLGLRNGILDQSAILLSRRGHLTHLDCGSLWYERIPWPDGAPPFQVLVAFSGLKKALVGTDYNQRVEECARAAEILLEAVGREEEQPLLGHLSAEEYEAHKGLLEGPPARRAAHFFSEVERVELGVEAWRKGDLERFGRLMTASGESSITNYECGSGPLIDLHRILVETEGVYGGRFSGAGFRGCCIGLVDPAAADQAAEQVRRRYAGSHPDLASDAPVVLCGSDDGARVIRPCQ